jgi:hypothetical protein
LAGERLPSSWRTCDARRPARLEVDRAGRVPPRTPVGHFSRWCAERAGVQANAAEGIGGSDGHARAGALSCELGTSIAPRVRCGRSFAALKMHFAADHADLTNSSRRSRTSVSTDCVEYATTSPLWLCLCTTWFRPSSCHITSA